MDKSNEADLSTTKWTPDSSLTGIHLANWRLKMFEMKLVEMLVTIEMAEANERPLTYGSIEWAEDTRDLLRQNGRDVTPPLDTLEEPIDLGMWDNWKKKGGSEDDLV